MPRTIDDQARIAASGRVRGPRGVGFAGRRLSPRSSTPVRPHRQTELGVLAAELRRLEVRSCTARRCRRDAYGPRLERHRGMSVPHAGEAGGDRADGTPSYRAPPHDGPRSVRILGVADPARGHESAQGGQRPRPHRRRGRPRPRWTPRGSFARICTFDVIDLQADVVDREAFGTVPRRSCAAPGTMAAMHRPRRPPGRRRDSCGPRAIMPSSTVACCSRRPRARICTRSCARSAGARLVLGFQDRQVAPWQPRGRVGAVPRLRRDQRGIPVITAASIGSGTVALRGRDSTDLATERQARERQRAPVEEVDRRKRTDRTTLLVEIERARALGVPI